MESKKKNIPPKPSAAAAAATNARLEAEALSKPGSLFKHHSWSPDILRDEVWSRRKQQQKLRDSRRCKSVSDEDLNELKACFELGFRFDSPDVDPKLCDTFPALEMFNTINKMYNRSLSISSSSSSTTVTDCGSPLSTDAVEPSSTIFDSGDDNPKKVKARLKQWAQLVACTIHRIYSSSSSSSSVVLMDLIFASSSFDSADLIN
ncbi:uncharacterized protein LOC124910165 [Impatiens glandulifera]|uniref:uncharacterized protein LOC124910165 n=1 Tax=Impatiens glandulifera TaxID=253017 RepID=UPI001FB12220|nr:uncharacterized protein LOC124910165 [Impatiens glandulifera]